MTPRELRTIRREAGYSVNALASSLGVDARTIRRWQLGQRRIPNAVAEKIRKLPPVDRRTRIS